MRTRGSLALFEKDKKRYDEEMERYTPPPKEDNASAVAQGGGLNTPELPSGAARVLDRSASRVFGAGASTSGGMKFRVGDAVSVRTTEAVWPRSTEGKVITIETDEEEEEPYEVKNSAGQEPKTWWFSEDELELVSAARPEPARGASGGKVLVEEHSVQPVRQDERGRYPQSAGQAHVQGHPPGPGVDQDPCREYSNGRLGL